MRSPESGFNPEKKEFDTSDAAEKLADLASKIVRANDGQVPLDSTEAKKIAQENNIEFEA